MWMEAQTSSVRHATLPIGFPSHQRSHVGFTRVCIEATDSWEVGSRMRLDPGKSLSFLKFMVGNLGGTESFQGWTAS